MTPRRWLPVAAALIVSLAASPAVGSDGQRESVRRLQPGPIFDLPAVQLRIALDRVLGEHAFLLIETMRTGLAEEATFRAAGAVLEANTTELVGMIEATYGAAAAAAFGEQWRNHVAFLVDYTRAIAADDVDAQDVAGEQLSVYVADFSSLLASANPNLPADVVSGLISEHVEQLEQIAALSSGDYAEAYDAIRATYAHMYTIGDGLAGGIAAQFPDRLIGRDVAFGPAIDLRISFDRLLGEHTFLAALAMRATLDGATDAAAAREALDANSAELADQIELLYGAEASAAFADLWQTHTDDYLAYVTAVTDDDAAGQAAALDQLGDYRDRLAGFLADANPFLSEDDLAALLQAHTDHLVEQVALYADGEVEASYEALRTAFAQTEELAIGLAGAIAAQFPQRFPDTAVAAGAWGAAPGIWGNGVGALLIVLGIALAVGYRHGRRRAGTGS